MRTCVLFVFLCGSLLRAQIDARQIVQKSIAVADRSWAAKPSYTFVERDEENHLDANGKIKSTNVEVSRALVVNGDTFEETISHNGQPPTPEKRKKEEEGLRKRQNETPEERQVRLNQEKEDRSFISEVPDAFTFELLGEQVIEGRPAYMLQASPKPDYHAHTKYGKMFSKVNGKLWVDREDYGWVKVEANVIEPFAMGFILARVQPGTRIVFQQTRVAEGVWLPKRVEVNADAKVMFLKNYRVQTVTSYADYQIARPVPPGSSATANSTVSR